MNHSGTAGHPPQDRHPVGAAPGQIGLLRILRVTQHHDRTRPRREEQRNSTISRAIHQPRLARQIINWRAGRAVDIEDGRRTHVEIEPQFVLCGLQRHNLPVMFCPNSKCPDFVDTGKHGEYVAGITSCPYCGEVLVDTLPTATEPPVEEPVIGQGAPELYQPDEDLEPVFETSDPTEVPVVRSFLDAHGIPHVLVGEERFDAFRGALSPFRFNPRAGVVAFLVPLQYAEAARDLLVELEKDE